MEGACIRALCACCVNNLDFISISLNAYMINLWSLKKVSKNSRNFHGNSRNVDFVACGVSTRYFVIASCSYKTVGFEKIIARI